MVPRCSKLFCAFKSLCANYNMNTWPSGRCICCAPRTRRQRSPASSGLAGRGNCKWPLGIHPKTTQPFGSVWSNLCCNLVNKPLHIYAFEWFWPNIYFLNPQTGSHHLLFPAAASWLSRCLDANLWLGAMASFPPGQRHWKIPVLNSFELFILFGYATWVELGWWNLRNIDNPTWGKDETIYQPAILIKADECLGVFKFGFAWWCLMSNEKEQTTNPMIRMNNFFKLKFMDKHFFVFQRPGVRFRFPHPIFAEAWVSQSYLSAHRI